MVGWIKEAAGWTKDHAARRAVHVAILRRRGAAMGQFAFDSPLPGSAAVPLSEITPKDLKDLRDLVNMTVVDAAMYMTGRHQATLLRFVRQEMNHIFATFGMASWRGQAGVRADDVTDGRVLGRLPRVLTLASAACAVAASSNGSVSRNPRFLKSGGRVSILGHSLGSVIAFDVLSSMHASAYTSLSAAEADDDPAVAHVCAALATCGRGARRPRSPC